MAKNKEEKTNVMRFLEQKKIAYTAHTYPHEEGMAVDGVTVAKSMGFDPAIVFKTLVARGASKQYYVFDVPVAENLDLKKAAKAVGEKSIEMIHQKELLPLIANKDFKPFDGQCSLELHVYRSIPKSFGRKKQFAAANGEIRPTTRPDTDNYVKGILDALNGIVVKDDSQIVDIVAQKFYSDTPRIEVVVAKQC